MTTPESLTSALTSRMVQAIAAAGGWVGFDAFMAQALYEPGLGYYANDLRKLGLMPGEGSDFVTAPELSPLFGQALAAQLRQALDITGTDEIWEFGAGSGALAQQLLDALGPRVARYTIVDVSGALRARQQQGLQRFGAQVGWATELPPRMHGVLLGNEVLDAMPVKLLVRLGGIWHERGVGFDAAAHGFVWQDRPTDLRPPTEIEGGHDYLSEIHPQAEAFMRTIAERLGRGAAFFVDYGFPEGEYYHVQRAMGTVMCHRAHQADTDPLREVGLKDITAHVNFTGVALAAQDAGLSVLGYASQARFLLNCGIAQLMEAAPLPVRAQAHKLLAEHEMGELFKVIGLTAGEPWDAMGFTAGDRTHTL